jgi:hypothetical protein
MHITCPIVGTAGGQVHATKARLRKSRRKTYDALCGVRVKLIVHDVQGGGHITAPWPPYVSDAKLWGDFTRCADCLAAAPGKPQRVHLVPKEAA